MKQFCGKIFLFFLLLLTSSSTFANYICEVDGIFYDIQLTDKTAQVSYKGTYGSSNYAGNIKIPASITFSGFKFNVTGIGMGAFYGCNDLTSIDIPSSVTRISSLAFKDCASLNFIEIPNSVTTIDSSTFEYCTSLTSIKIPNSVTSIGSWAFEGCTSLTSLEIPNSVTTIGGYAFQDCTGLTSIDIPNSVTTIGSGAFQGCTGLTSIDIPNSVTTIGSSAFSGCIALTNITIPNSVTKIDYGAFSDCTSLTNIEIPIGVTNINSGLFSGCTELVSVKLPNSITKIDGYAFKGCTSLSSIEIPYKVTSIETSAFEGCTGLNSIKVALENNVYNDGNGCNCIIKTISNNLILGCKSTVIPNSVTTISSGAFYGCTGLTSIVIPNSVTSIGWGPFSGCTGLTSIKVDSGNDFYNDGNGSNCIIETKTNRLVSGCQSTVIPYGVTDLGWRAFADCTNLTSIIIPGSVTRISAYAFEGCTGLTSIDIPNSVTTIQGGAFRDCSSLSSVNIPNSVTTIGGSAFQGCTGLTSIDIPNSVTTIDNSAFSGCTSLTSINIPNSVTTINNRAFEGCSGLVISCDNEIPPSASDESFNEDMVAIVPPSSVNAYLEARGWNKMAVNTSLSVVGISQTSITLVSSGVLTSENARCEGKSYYLEKDTIRITGLEPNSLHTIYTEGIYKDKTLKSRLYVTTLSINPSIEVISKTNTTLCLVGHPNAGDAKIGKRGFENYEAQDTLMLTGLIPGMTYTFTYYAESPNGEFRYTATTTVKTEGIGLYPLVSVGPTNLMIGVFHSNIDANIIDAGFEEYPGMNIVEVYGLDPEKEYSIPYYVISEECGKQTRWLNYKTNSLTMTSLPPKVVNEGNVIVAASTNIDENETSVGFEWRRTDWPDDFPSNKGAAAIYKGQMEGYIRNINANYLWKVRPYYVSNEGNCYYGDWTGVDPSNTSYFEPTVHTYEKIDVKGNSAMVKGYALNGTDKVTVQGFKYWKSTSKAKVRNDEYDAAVCQKSDKSDLIAAGTGNPYSETEEKTVEGASAKSAPHHLPDVPVDAMTVEAKGQVMTADLTDLEYGSNYNYVAFVTTSEGDTFYGEILSFTTEDDPNARLKGDVNEDKNVDISDIVAVINQIAGAVSYKYADVNGDKNVDISDIVAIINVIASK